MSRYTTIVIRMPEDSQGLKKIEEGMALLAPFRTAMSIEDEMTILELIENHEDFDPRIADDARAQTKMLHAEAAANGV